MEFRFIEPAADFSNGIAVLYAYHESLLAHGTKLLALVAAIHKHGIDETRAYQAVALHSYYTRANLLHHQDEEKALFPCLVNRSSFIDGMLERLTLDHEEIEQAWSTLAINLKSPEQIAAPWHLLQNAGEFERIQREHLTRENEDFLPPVQELLNPAELKHIGFLMARMRGLKISQN